MYGTENDRQSESQYYWQHCSSSNSCRRGLRAVPPSQDAECENDNAGQCQYGTCDQNSNAPDQIGTAMRWRLNQSDSKISEWDSDACKQFQQDRGDYAKADDS